MSLAHASSPQPRWHPWVVALCGAVAAATKHGKGVVVDLIGVSDKAARAREVVALGAVFVEMHAGLDEQAEDGYSLDAEESALEGCCFGAPIRDASGVVYGALSLSMPKSRMKPAARRPRVIAAVRRAAERISTAR